MEESFSLLDVTKLSIGDRQYTVSVGDKEAVSQLFYCYKDEKKGVIPGGNWQCDSDRLGRPFAHSIVISEAVPTESAYADFDGVDHDPAPGEAAYRFETPLLASRCWNRVQEGGGEEGDEGSEGEEGKGKEEENIEEVRL